MACFVLGPGGVINWANASGRRLGRGDAARARVQELVHASSRDDLHRLVAQAMDTGRSEGTVRLAAVAATLPRYYQVVLRRTEDTSGAGLSGPSGPAPVNLLMQGWDVTALVQRQQELETRAFQDALTGVSSRWAFIARLEHELERSRGNGQSVALLFADVDRFTLVNDTFGHEAGDCVLAELATRFQATLRPGDTLGRIGGVEFAVICPSTPGWTAVTSVMERLRAVAAEPIPLPAGVVRVTVSIGAAFADEVDLGVHALLAQADARMFGVKTASRPHCVDGQH